MAAAALHRVVAPFDQRVLAEGIRLADLKSAQNILGVASNVAKARKPLPTHKRIEILERTAVGMERDRDALATTIASECGKPIVHAHVEVQRAIETVRLGITTLYTQSHEQVPMGLSLASAGRHTVTMREPIGTVLAICAFNHPLNLVAHQVVPAVATGCPVVIKPSLNTPLSCINFVERLRTAGLEEPWCQVLLADNAVVDALAREPAVNYLSFIGSARVGWQLRSNAAPGTRVALEHGGVGPVIVDKSCDFDTMIPALAHGAFYHAGQVCVATQRVFVPNSMVDVVSSSLASAAEFMPVGDPLDIKTKIGPLIAHREVDRVHEWVTEAVQKGGRLVCGGKRLSSPSLYPPTVVVNPPTNCRLSQSEIFGPVVAVYGYETLQEAIQRANAVPWGFQASVFSNHMPSVWEAAKRLNATAVMVNDHTAFRVDWMPFGGRGQSGLGMGGIPYSMHEMTEPKMIVFNNM